MLALLQCELMKLLIVCSFVCSFVFGSFAKFADHEVVDCLLLCLFFCDWFFSQVGILLVVVVLVPVVFGVGAGFVWCAAFFGDVA